MPTVTIQFDYPDPDDDLFADLLRAVHVVADGPQLDVHDGTSWKMQAMLPGPDSPKLSRIVCMTASEYDQWATEQGWEDDA